MFEYIANKFIQQKDKSRIVNKKISVKKTEASLSTSRKETHSESESKATAPYNLEVITIPARKPISLPIQRKIFQKDKCCQYQDKQTGKQCQSQWRLTIDHIQPIWAGGSNDPENLLILCLAHNQELYRQQASISQI